jgi:hypothetical protein
MGRETYVARLRVAIGILVVALVAVVALALTSDEDPTSDRDRSAGGNTASADAGEASVPRINAGEGGGSSTIATSGDADGRPAPSAGEPERPAAWGGASAEAGFPAAGPDPAVTCPAEMSRAECEAMAQAAAAAGPSYTIEKPRDCLKVMSRADCREWLRQDYQAWKERGPTFELKDCLDYLSRADCSAVYESVRPESQ